MRRWLMLLALIIILALLVVLNRSAHNWIFTVPAAPGALIYVAAFEDYLDEWEPARGRLSAEAVDGVMRVAVDTEDSSVFSPSLMYFSDFDLSVEATAVSGPVANGAGIVFRLRDPSNYYAFIVGSDGWYQVQRYANGTLRLLSTWIESPAVRVGIGETNVLRVMATGNRFQFYINGQRVLLCIPDDPNAQSTLEGETCKDGQMLDTLIDDSFSSGYLGLVGTSGFYEGGVVIEFDNLIVYGPEQDEDPS